MKKAFITLCAVVILITAMAIPASAKGSLEDIGGKVQFFWVIADVATMDFSVSGGKAKAELYYEIPSAASGRYKYRIEERPTNGGSWKGAATGSTTLPSSSNVYSVSCTAKDGYDYRVIASLTVTLRGKSEVINFEEEA
jgi:hypothetical protein